ncbi:MAG: anhydro-N-acetylmuramic acid kinase [Acidobacteria bacterium]|nr:anhydro-N-acetylmuramic acid kinase [Acidobacteriota bacterium]
MIVAGIMSGTSLDGIDVAIVDMPSARLLDFRSRSYSAALRRRLLAVSNAECHTRDIARLHFELAELYAKAIPQRVDLIGCHGQTIYHEGRRATLQIGDGSVLAARAGAPVVCDFRPADIAAGGEGAPLVPFVDYRFFRHPRRTRVALNIGGIANITIIPARIPAGASLDDVIAMDTGPGNMVMDALAAHATNGRLRYDRDGRMAARGHVNRPLLSQLLRAPFYRRRPPKSAGREEYGAQFVTRLLATGLPVNDLLSTAAALTATTIAHAIQRFSTTPADDLIASGGGARNPFLMAQLAAFLPGVRMAMSSEFGLDAHAKEAIAFALLAYETWRKRPSNVPSATGARYASILGKLCLPPR